MKSNLVSGTVHGLISFCICVRYMCSLSRSELYSFHCAGFRLPTYAYLQHDWDRYTSCFSDKAAAQQGFVVLNTLTANTLTTSVARSTNTEVLQITALKMSCLMNCSHSGVVRVVFCSWSSVVWEQVSGGMSDLVQVDNITEFHTLLWPSSMHNL